MPAELSLEWHIFDTAMMAAQGRKTYSAEPLRFVSEWDDIPNKSYDVILASNALQCFDNPWIVLDRLTSIQCSYLVLHEIPVISAAQDRITIQRPPRIPIRKNYRKANFPLFPTWFFAEEALLKRLAKDYAVKIWWHSGTIALLDGRPIARKSYLLEKK